MHILNFWFRSFIKVALKKKKNVMEVGKRKLRNIDFHAMIDFEIVHNMRSDL